MYSEASLVAIDFETANRHRASACQVALTKLVDGEITDRFNTLIHPPSDIEWSEFEHVHGIKPEDWADSPTWDEIVSDLSEFVDGMQLVAHNAPFDLSVWVALDEYYGTASAPYEMLCTLRLARAHLGHLPSKSLPHVVGALVPEFQLDHHEAGSDADACALAARELLKLDSVEFSREA